MLISFVYASNTIELGVLLWLELCDWYTRVNQAPWIIAGDFNVVLDMKERFGGLPVREYEIEDFIRCINDCHLDELKHSGNFFTWNNKNETRHRVFCRLDRVLINEHWLYFFAYSHYHAHPQ